ncbi:MAG: type II toxin-antitoxin system HigB family toxin [Bacteroidales bacterium]
MFNIIARKNLLEYCKRYHLAALALQEWYHEMAQHDFNNFNELKNVYGNASIIADNRVIFNIMGNNYRLIVRVSFQYKAIQIKWFGTLAEYNNTDVTGTNFKKKQP